MRTSTRDTHFQIWKERINNHVIKHIDLTVDDLPDQPYRIYFEETDMTPLELAGIIIHNYNMDY